MKNKFARLDGRHKLAIVGSLVCWVMSLYFSYLGFKLENSELVWIGWFLAGIVTVVELVFNSSTSKLPLTLIVVGILCYGYGIWTNVVGFWNLQHPDVPFVILSTKSIMAWFIGLIMEVLPEPLFMWGIMASLDGDFMGNIAGLWNGTLDIAKPGEGQARRAEYHVDKMPESIRKLKKDDYYVNKFPETTGRPKPRPVRESLLQDFQKNTHSDIPKLHRDESGA